MLLVVVRNSWCLRLEVSFGHGTPGYIYTYNNYYVYILINPFKNVFVLSINN